MSSSTKPRMRPFKSPSQFITTSFGASCLPGKIPRKIPGTMGTIPAIGLWWLMAAIFDWTTSAMVALTILMFFAGIPLVDRVSKELGVHDDSRITWDEIVGYFTAALFAPSGFWWLVFAFVLFRYFDMLKPFPVNLFDLRQGPFWVMVDDVAGGLLAGLLLWGFTVEWRIALGVLVGHVVLMLVARLALRYDREIRGLTTPSVLDALSSPRSAW